MITRGANFRNVRALDGN